MNVLDERPLPAPFEIEVIDRRIAKIEGKRPVLEAGENRISRRHNRFEADPPAVQRALFQQAGGLGGMVFGHEYSSSSKSLSTKRWTSIIVRDPKDSRPCRNERTRKVMPGANGRAGTEDERMVQEELPPTGAAESAAARQEAVALGRRSSRLGSFCCRSH